ncbi:transposase [Trichloromonas sp.]|uniref:transposase n=1 Tax=Trichloromonas sp. TaxID=3069249 RepID=UPI003D81BBD5
MQHVIVRGIEKSLIFHDDRDRQFFVDRLSRLLAETGTDCLAWALIPNHFHLLLRPIHSSLASFMRRLLTGYAVSFNRRHQRVGHLFQNRYKSIVCQEDNYLLELVRYIHLNPVRAGLVPDIVGIDHYPWSGHACLVGNRHLKGQNPELVLSHFGDSVVSARERYRQFVADGMALGDRLDLVGKDASRAGRGDSDDAAGFVQDNRILGTQLFAEYLANHESLAGRIETKESLEHLADRTAAYFRMDRSVLLQPSKEKTRVEARSVFCYLGVRCLGYKGTEVGALLGLGRSAVCHAVKRGEVMISADRSIELRIVRK